MTKQMTFVQAMKDYFGLKPNQTAVEFMHEMKQLTPEDKAWFRQELPKVGYEIVAV